MDHVRPRRAHECRTTSSESGRPSAHTENTERAAVRHVDGMARLTCGVSQAIYLTRDMATNLLLPDACRI